MFNELYNDMDCVFRRKSCKDSRLDVRLENRVQDTLQDRVKALERNRNASSLMFLPMSI